MTISVQGISNWLKKRDAFTSIVVVSSGVLLSATAITSMALLLAEGSSIPSIPSGWAFLITTAMAVGIGIIHHIMSGIDADGELSYNGLRDYLQEKTKEPVLDAERAKKATTASIAECLALGVIASTIISSFGFDILTSLAVFGAVPAIAYSLGGQKLTQLNYWALDKVDPLVTTVQRLA